MPVCWTDAAAQTLLASNGRLELVEPWAPGFSPRHRDLVSCLCKKCGGVLQRRLASLLSGLSTCHLCSRLTSSAQHEINAWVQSLGFPTIQGDRTVIRPLEIDIYVPTAKVGIEYHSLYWHSESPGGPSLKYNHARKYEAAKAAGVRLLQVYEDEWSGRRSAVEHLICGSLGLLPRYGARTFKVEALAKPEADIFYQTFHIQGPPVHGLHYALVSATGDPVAVMTFSALTSRRGAVLTEGQWELTRFATSFRVPGAASRLWAAFVADYAPVGVVTYCDHRYFDGDVYARLGMTAIGRTVDYEYVWNGERWRKSFGVKSNLRKVLDLPDEAVGTESELAAQLGARRLWNAGKTTFRWGSSHVKPMDEGESISPEQIKAAWESRFKTSTEKRIATISTVAYRAARRAGIVAGWSHTEGTPEFLASAKVRYHEYLRNPELFYEHQRAHYKEKTRTPEAKARRRTYSKPDPEKTAAYLAAYRSDPKNREKHKAYMQIYNQSQKAKERDKEFRSDPEKVEARKERQRAYYYTPEAAAARKARQATPEYKAKNREKSRANYLKKKKAGELPPASDLLM